MVQDDVIQFMKSVAEGGMDQSPDTWMDMYDAYENGRQAGFTELARILLQKMGVSYGTK